MLIHRRVLVIAKPRFAEFMLHKLRHDRDKFPFTNLLDGPIKFANVFRAFSDTDRPHIKVPSSTIFFWLLYDRITPKKVHSQVMIP